MKKLEVVGLSLIFAATGLLSPFATASTSVPARPSVCENESSEKIKKYIEKQQDTCESKYNIDTSNKAESSKFWSNNADANCDLGLSFPSLPGFGFDLSSLNACEIAQALTENVVSEVNDATQAAVDGVTESITGDADGFDFDFDANDYILDEMNSN